MDILIGMLIMYFITAIILGLNEQFGHGLGCDDWIEWIYLWWFVAILKGGKWFYDMFIFPIIHIRLTIWCIKNGINPWRTKAKEIKSLSDDKFDEFLNLLDKKSRKQWEEYKFGRKKMK